LITRLTWPCKSEEGQKEFARSVAPDIARWLDGRPFAYVPGNHDMIELEPFLKNAGVNVFRITTKGTEILGKVFAGFPNVGPISGHWNYETEGDEMQEITKKAFEANPDILLVHNPPYNCRDLVWSGERIGNSYLTNMLTYQEHKIRHIFCGHVHENVGHEILLEKVNVYNNATRFALIETND
jgi:Icc-related predicted phosphoesterase